MVKALITCRSLIGGRRPERVAVSGLVGLLAMCYLFAVVITISPLSPLRPPLLPSAFIGPTRCSAPGFITPANENHASLKKNSWFGSQAGLCWVSSRLGRGCLC